jgi:RNA polymerase sigma factor (sigma-70 family)
VNSYTHGVTPRLTEPTSPGDALDADQAVIDRVLAGDRNSFGILIERYSDPLYRHAFGMTGSADVAEDILQVSFIKAFHHLGEVRGRFDAWVFRIVANGCKDWLKNIRRSHLSYEEDDQPSSLETPEEELDPRHRSRHFGSRCGARSRASDCEEVVVLGRAIGHVQVRLRHESVRSGALHVHGAGR